MTFVDSAQRPQGSKGLGGATHTVTTLLSLPPPVSCSPPDSQASSGLMESRQLRQMENKTQCKRVFM